MIIWDALFEFVARSKRGIAQCAIFNSDLPPLLRTEHFEQPATQEITAGDAETEAVTAIDRCAGKKTGHTSLLAQYLLYRF